MAYSGGHRVGGSGPEVVLFSRYSCQFCRAMWTRIDSAITRGDWSYSVRVRHLVAPDEGVAFEASIASECAARQGKFYDFHSALVANWDSLIDSQA